MKTTQLLLAVVACLAIPSRPAFAQTLLSGPVQMHTTDTLSNVWLLVRDAQRVEMTIFDSTYSFRQTYTALTGMPHEATILLPFHNLQPATTYRYRIVLDTTLCAQGTLHTLPTTQPNAWKDISFLAASCASVSDGLWQKLGIGAKKRPFQAAKRTQADFMLWLGDNFYYRAGEWNDSSRMWRRNVRTRTYKPLRQLLETRPNYAIWDDHDFGANNTDSNFETKYYSLDLFKEFWGNPSYGIADEAGVFHQFKQQDAEFFMLDGRFKKIRGSSAYSETQWQWLFDALLQSKATFKFIVGGVQFLQPKAFGFEALSSYPPDRERLLGFIEKNNIKGIIFLSGDRHFAELYRLPRTNTYDLWEVTTSGINTNGSWLMTQNSPRNPIAVPNTKYTGMNYARFTLSGNASNRQCKVEMFDKKGNILYDHSWSATDLGY